MDQENLPQISVIIPSKDRKDILIECLNALKKGVEGLSYEIIVVNDSEDDLNLEISGLNIVCIKNPYSGVASARNFGVTKASGTFLLFLDDDMLMGENVIATLLDESDQYSGSCINVNWEYPKYLKASMGRGKFGRFLLRYGFTSLKGWYRNHVWEDDAIFRVKAITSQALFMSKKTFDRIGGYNEEFPFAGFEDYDLLQRTLENEVPIYVNSNLLVYHNERDRANDIVAWMARRQRGGRTRKVAVDMGYDELRLSYGVLKSTVYRFVNANELWIHRLLRTIPDIRLFDRISFFIINLLYGASVFRGYHFDNVK